MIRNILLICGLGFILSCHVSIEKELGRTDSVNIFLTALRSRTFLKGNLVYSDSLYFIKSKFYHEGFPTSSEYFKLFYIDDNPKNKRLNFPGTNNDKRERYEITKLSLSEDKANIVLYNLGVREGYEYNLQKKENGWIILNESAVMY
jgi:hypothetical protein